jgi:sugar/nucleoside kinase (ribokinase family)
MKIVFAGHVCLDQNVVRGVTETLYGGGVVHGAITAQRLGAQAVALTKCAEDDRRHFHHLGDAGVEVIFRPSPQSTSIRNVYPTENPDDRQSFLISHAAPFSEDDLEQIVTLNADAVHINPLWFGEFPLALLHALRPRTAMLAADAQGFLRVAEPEGRMVHRDFPRKREILSLLDLFKVDSKEAFLLTGEEDPQRAIRSVHSLGPKMVLLTHREGVCVFDGSAMHQSRFSGFTLEGRTGRGDTCTASFLVARGRGMKLAEAVAFAAEITSRKMKYRGPYRG